MASLLLLAAAMLVPVQAGAQSRKRGSTQRKTTVTAKKSSNQSVKPLVVKRLRDYLTTNSEIKFTTTKTTDEYPRYLTITVTKKGHKPQTFDIDGFECDPELFALVHFVDANFDGYTDLYLGTGEDRTYNNILLWNESQGRFTKVFPENGNHVPMPLFCAETKSILSPCSGGAYCGFILEFKPSGNTLVLGETCLEIEYGANDQDRYLLHQGGGEGPVIATYRKISSLSAHWQRVLQAVRKVQQEDSY